MRNRIAAVLVATCFFPWTAARASVLVVDAANGPGTDFTAIFLAVQAAAPGDVILVRSGTYVENLTIDKGLTLTADAGASVKVHSIEVAFLGAGEHVFLRNLEIDPGMPSQFLQPLGAAFNAHQNDGTVWVEECDFTLTPVLSPFGVGGVRVSLCEAVVFTRCSMAPAIGNGVIATLQAELSTVRLFDCFVQGKLGLSGVFPLDGSNAVRAIDSYVVATGCTLLGGNGGNGTHFVGCSDGSDGGAAIGVKGATSRVVTAGCTLSGGIGGQPSMAPCSPGANAPAVFVESGVYVDAPLVTGRTLTSNAPVREGGTITLDWPNLAPPVSGGQMWIAIAPLPVDGTAPALPGLLGAQLSLDATAMTLVHVGSLPASLTVPILVPELGPGVESGTLLVQGLVLANAQATATAPTQLIVLDSAF